MTLLDGTMDRTMKNIKKYVMGVLFLLTGLLLFFYPDYKEWKNHKSVEAIMEGIETIQEEENHQNIPENTPEETEEMKTNKEDDADEDPQPVLQELYEELKNYNIRLVTEGQHITDVWSFQQTPVNLAKWNQGSDAIGCLEIPDINLSMPLFIGATEKNMALGAVVLSETSMPVGGENTNCVIAGHRGWSGSPYFRDIDKLKGGSLVYLITPWEKMAYKVTGSEIIHETDCSILNIRQGKDMVTLFSCYPYMAIGTSYRLAIFCERTETEEITTEETYLKADEEMTDIVVSEIIKQDMEKKGIIIRDNPYQTFIDSEDTIRKVLPVMILFLLIMMKGIRSLQKSFSVREKRSDKKKGNKNQ